MNGGLRLFRLFGIDVKIHFSWWFIFVLLAWSLHDAFFPQEFPGFSSQQYWIMGIVAALLLFASVLLHELSHSLVAKARKIKVESITLFFFGGVAGISQEDMEPKSEFLMAIAGPLFSLFFAGVFYSIFLLTTDGLWHPIVYYVAFINLILAIFNLVPAFPLDGGRAFRALLHAHYKDLRKATRIAATGGRIFAGYLVLEGFLNFFGISLLVPGGLWFILLGGFLYFLAGMSYEQVVMKEILGKIPVRSLPRKTPLVFPPTMAVASLMKQSAWSGAEAFVVRGKQFQGLLDVQHFPKLTPSQQKTVQLKAIATPLHKGLQVSEKETAYEALQRMTQQQRDVLVVMDGKNIVGLLTKQDIILRLLWEGKRGGITDKGINLTKRTQRNKIHRR